MPFGETSRSPSRRRSFRDRIENRARFGDSAPSAANIKGYMRMKLGILLASRRLEEIPDRQKQAREAGFTLCQVNLHQAGLTRNDLVTLDQFVDHHVRPAAIGCYVNPL